MGYTMICPKKNNKSWGYIQLDILRISPIPSHPSQLPAANIWPSLENARHVTAAAAFRALVASRRIRVGSAEAKSQKMKPAGTWD